ncbi:hypothetical protein E0F15_20595 [Frankia sp. B2]|uniref:hypothetical protein n=1 Tax=Frankia sp. B2 TaxID=2541730 RepID=UPI00106939BB|nr:hypothetical protein [Frankia sp. B2]TFE25058.1 hypothetical protein E0F15_20595 [Frankia sp. B2]
MPASLRSPSPVHTVLAAGDGWFVTFNNLIDHAKALALGALGVVIVATILTTLHTSKGAIAKVIAVGLTGAVAYWLATSYDANSKRTDREINGAPVATVAADAPSHMDLDAVVLGRASSRSGT